MIHLEAQLQGHEGRVWHASWSPDGSKVASCGEDRTIRIWNVAYGHHPSCIAVLDEAQSRTIRNCEWAPDGRTLSAASFDGTVMIWQTLDRTLTRWERLATLEGHDNEVKSTAWSNDGLLLATCGRDKKIWIWERISACDFECVAVLDGHGQDVKFILWHPSLHVLLSTSYDDTIRIWGEEDGDWFCIKSLIGHTSTVWGAVWDMNGSTIASCSDDMSVILWECDSPSNPKKDWRKICTARNLHEGSLYSIDWNITFDKIVTGGGDDKLVILRCARSDDGLRIVEIEYEQMNAHCGDVNCVRWNPSYHPDMTGLLISAGDDGILNIWRLCSV